MKYDYDLWREWSYKYDVNYSWCEDYEIKEYLDGLPIVNGEKWDKISKEDSVDAEEHFYQVIEEEYPDEPKI
jgi:hypothetical protein